MRDADALAIVMLAVAAGALVYRMRAAGKGAPQDPATLTLADWFGAGFALDQPALDAPSWAPADSWAEDPAAPVVDLDAMRSAPNIVGEFFQPVAALASELGWLGGFVTQSQVQQDANVVAFLQMIRFAEGTAGPDGYRTMFGGKLFDSFADHPRQVQVYMLGGKRIASAAAGAYQIMPRTWDWVRTKISLPDFSPASQDAAAIWLIKYRGGLDHVRAGRFAEAVNAVRNEWASMPAAPYGQPTKKLTDLQAVYAAAGGNFASSGNVA